MKAVAEVHKRTGVPIVVHTSAAGTGLVALDVLVGEGMDRFGLGILLPHDRRLQTVVKLVENPRRILAR